MIIKKEYVVCGSCASAITNEAEGCIVNGSVTEVSGEVLDRVLNDAEPKAFHRACLGKLLGIECKLQHGIIGIGGTWPPAGLPPAIID